MIRPESSLSDPVTHHELQEELRRLRAAVTLLSTCVPLSQRDARRLLVLLAPPYERHEYEEPQHEWEFYANGSFCKRCGAQIGSGTPCR